MQTKTIQQSEWHPIHDALYNYTHEFLLAAVDAGVNEAGVTPLTPEGRREVTRPMLVQLAYSLIVMNNPDLRARELKIDQSGRYTIEIPGREN